MATFCSVCWAGHSAVVFSFNSPEAKLSHAPDSGCWTWPWAQSAHGAPAQGLCLKGFWFPGPLPAGSCVTQRTQPSRSLGRSLSCRRSGSHLHLGTGWPHRGGNVPSQCTCCLGSRLSPAGPGDPVSLAETAGTVVCHSVPAASFADCRPAWPKGWGALMVHSGSGDSGGWLSAPARVHLPGHSAHSLSCLGPSSDCLPGGLSTLLRMPLSLVARTTAGLDGSLCDSIRTC